MGEVAEKIQRMAASGTLAGKSEKEKRDLYNELAAERAKEAEDRKKRKKPTDGSGYLPPDYDGPAIPPHILPYIKSLVERLQSLTDRVHDLEHEVAHMTLDKSFSS